MEHNLDRWRIAGLGAVGLGIVAIIAALSLGNSNGSDSPASTEPPDEVAVAADTPDDTAAADAQDATETRNCFLKIDSAVLVNGPDSGLPGGFRSFNVTGQAISPAVSLGSDEIQLAVKTSTVDCDTTNGVIGLRRGVRLNGESRSLELRRFRIDVSGNKVTMFTRSLSPQRAAMMTTPMNPPPAVMASFRWR